MKRTKLNPSIFSLPEHKCSENYCHSPGVVVVVVVVITVVVGVIPKQKTATLLFPHLLAVVIKIWLPPAVLS